MVVNRVQANFHGFLMAIGVEFFGTFFHNFGNTNCWGYDMFKYSVVFESLARLHMKTKMN